MDTSDYRTVSYSQTTITELMIPSYSNFGGKIHGGILLSLMDKVAYVCAAKHSGNYCVTASIDTVDFLQPIEVGELVSLMASVNYVGNTSLVVGIRVVSENVKTNVVNHTAYFLTYLLIHFSSNSFCCRRQICISEYNPGCTKFPSYAFSGLMQVFQQCDDPPSVRSGFLSGNLL